MYHYCIFASPRSTNYLVDNHRIFFEFSCADFFRMNSFEPDMLAPYDSQQHPQFAAMAVTKEVERMHNQIVKPDPADFGLNSFLQLYGKRDPIPGEMGLSFDTFRRSLLAHYAPKTGYEATLVDNLVDIQWQINQQCEMRNTLLRDEINTAIIKAVVDQEYNVWDDQIDTERDAWIEAGNDEDDFEHEDFDHQGAKKRGKSLARGLVQTDANARARAEEEMEELGLSSQSLKAEIYRQNSGSIDNHNETIEKLEDRRRRVQADIEALQAARPVDQAPVIEG